MAWWKVIVGRDRDKPDHPGKPDKPDAIDLANNKLLRDINRDVAALDGKITKIDKKLDYILIALKKLEDQVPPQPPKATTMKVELGDSTEKP